MIQFTIEEIQMLCEGLDALPTRNLAGNIMGDLMSIMLMKGDPEAYEKVKRERQQREVQEKKENDVLSERAALLKGKLLQYKQGVLSETVGSLS